MPDASLHPLMLTLYGASMLATGVVIAATVRAYRLTREPFLTHLVYAFGLLEISYLFVVLNRLYGTTALSYHATLWVHETTMVAAFGWIALAYYLRGRDHSEVQARHWKLALTGGVSLALAGFFAVPPTVAYMLRRETADAVYAIGLMVLVLLIWTTARTYRRNRDTGPWVPAGFGAWAVGQASWVAWALTDMRGALVAANVCFVVGLIWMAVATLPMWRRT